MSVMIGVKVKDAAIWLSRFVCEVENLEGSIKRVVAFYGQSRDETYSILKHWEKTSKHKIEIYSDPYLAECDRHGWSLAAVKQDVQRLLREGNEEFYLNLDCDLVQIPPDLIARLMARDKQTIAPMIWTEGRDEKTFFDIFIFRKENCMFHPLQPPGLWQSEPFQVDSVSTCYLAKREMELAGVYSNPYPPIPFYAGLRAKGFEVWVDPTIDVYHVDLEKYGILHHAQPSPYSNVPFIKNTGEKCQGNFVAAERFQLDVDKYARWVQTNQPEQAKFVEGWLEKRPLISASVKVLNSGMFLKEFLTGLYPNVDKIDIVEGAVKQAMHAANADGSSKDDTVQIIKEFPDPDHKITLVQGKWAHKEEVQAKLLEMCLSKWMLFIDCDEFLTEHAWQSVRQFCGDNVKGEVTYARPERFLHFFHDWKHIAYSLNPLSPWAQFGVPHPFLLWHDTPGLNFQYFHTMPVDGFGRLLTVDNPFYRGKQRVLDGVFVYHFGNAISKAAMRDKLIFEYARGRKTESVDSDLWFAGSLPADMVIEDFNGDYPAELLRHSELGKIHVKVTATKPVYKFERLD
jgi:hypothetical protein